MTVTVTVTVTVVQGTPIESDGHELVYFWNAKDKLASVFLCAYRKSHGQGLSCIIMKLSL